MPAANAKKMLARDFIFEIDVSATLTPDWEKIGGINSFSFDPSKGDTDTTDFDSAGKAEHLVASRSYAMTLDGQRKEDPVDGAQDAGQEAVELLSDEIGPDSIGHFRFYHSITGKGREFRGSVNTAGPGGGNDDAASWGGRGNGVGCRYAYHRGYDSVIQTIHI